MAQSAHGVDRNDLEKGFDKGVARALAGGLKENDIRNDRDELLDKIQEIMEQISSDEEKEGKTRPNWSSRGVEHAAENITTFEIAWRVERPPTSKSIKEDEIRDYLLAFRRDSNCWSHNGD